MGWECNLSLEVEIEFYVFWMCLQFLLHWKRAFEIGWHTSGWVRIEENSSWGLEVLGELGRMFFTACELENSQDEVDIRSACLTVHFPCFLPWSLKKALRFWPPETCSTGLKCCQCTGFTLQVAPAKAAQVVCGAGLGTKSVPSLGPAQGPARYWSLSSRMPEPQADFC